MSKLTTLIDLMEDESFTSDVLVDTFGKPSSLPKDVFLQHNLKVNIDWIMDEEKRSWGYKSLMPIVRDQTIKLIFLEATDNEDIEHNLDFDIKDCKVSFDFSDASGSSIQILPTSIELHLENGESEIKFSVT